MTKHAVDRSAPAPHATVLTGDGSEIPGFVIRTDTVLLVRPPGLQLPLLVNLGDGQRHRVVSVELAEPSATTTTAYALLLPAGTVEVDGDLFPPPDQMPALIVDPGNATRSIWCRLFPRIPGCF